ncbi:unnamed protein product [Fusarium graminearum]|nr:unnamed protein product [Fusarium graminearum]
MTTLQKCQNVDAQGAKCQRMVQVQVFDCFKVFPRYTWTDWVGDDSRQFDWSIQLLDCCNLGTGARAGLGRDDLALTFSLLLKRFSTN